MIWVGTSGFQYAEWKGTFYPEDLSTAAMLPYYSARFSTTEINYTFYRLPDAKTLQNWAGATPENFRFSLKAPRKITHIQKLENCSELTNVFCERAQLLGPKLGPLLFQLPPYLRVHVERLSSFLTSLPANLQIAFEFRHESWHTAEVYSLLRQHNSALCIADSAERKTPIELTARFGYFRLRDEGYERKDISRWAAEIASRAVSLENVYVYFKHEEKGLGPAFASWFKEELPRAE